MTNMAPAEHPSGWRGLLLPIGAIIGLVGIVLGLIFLSDNQNSANLAAIFYEAHAPPLVPFRL